MPSKQWQKVDLVRFILIDCLFEMIIHAERIRQPDINVVNESASVLMPTEPGVSLDTK